MIIKPLPSSVTIAGQRFPLSPSATNAIHDVFIAWDRLQLQWSYYLPRRLEQNAYWREKLQEVVKP